MELIIQILIFLLVINIAWIIIRVFTGRQRLLQQRLNFVLSETTVKGETRTSVRGKGSILRFLPLPGFFMRLRSLEKLQRSLVKAGLPFRAEEMVSVSLLSGFSTFWFGLLLSADLSISVVACMTGAFSPFLLVAALKSRRLKQLETQLLDAVVLLANSLRGGHSFIQALELTSREMTPPLSEEFGRVVRETKVGMPIDEALVNLGERVGSKDLQLVITGVLIQRQVGGNLAAILDTVADTIEKRIKMKGKIATLTAQGRLTAVVISLMPFGLAAFIYGRYPQFAQIMINEPMGKVMLIAGLGMLLSGIWVIRRVVNIDA